MSLKSEGPWLNPSSAFPNCVTWASCLLNLLLLVCKTRSIILRKVCVQGSNELSLAASTPGYKTGESFAEPLISRSAVSAGVCARPGSAHSGQREHSLLPRAQCRACASSLAAWGWDTLSYFCLRRRGLSKQLAHLA